MMISSRHGGNVLMEGRALVVRHADGSVTITPDDDSAHKQMRVHLTADEVKTIGALYQEPNHADR
ncbi:hypothetical protein [Azospirillum palustre]